jgi:hypothetical protein
MGARPSCPARILVMVDTHIVREKGVVMKIAFYEK